MLGVRRVSNHTFDITAPLLKFVLCSSDVQELQRGLVCIVWDARVVHDQIAVVDDDAGDVPDRLHERVRGRPLAEEASSCGGVFGRVEHQLGVCWQLVHPSEHDPSNLKEQIRDLAPFGCRLDAGYDPQLRVSSGEAVSVQVDCSSLDVGVLFVGDRRHRFFAHLVDLRRPVRIPCERSAVIRGIYQSAMFAKRYSSFNPFLEVSRWGSALRDKIACAINARFIMNNDIFCITDDMPSSRLPYCIWHPNRAIPETYAALARRRPEMKQQAARACIVADYQPTFDEIDAEADEALLAEAKVNINPHYLEAIERKAALQGSVTKIPQEEVWKIFVTKEDRFDKSSEKLFF
ncbi:hypothetical protein K402DRAFT_454985 [Aulographum hederae CBS 113979]|uniref:Uncharacterized protein n=1 Tax=Aulographum hederae CBS 113979 TaxID=1176131 RepID=A0A6G1GXZ6_9PEZI|nr:hypothetical protein K402DRAFT_454985 [Aulographum hederae CBS 113979]